MCTFNLLFGKIPPPCKFGQALFKLGEINEDEDSVAAHDSLRARNRSGSPAKSIGEKYYGSFVFFPCVNNYTVTAVYTYTYSV